MVSKIAVMALVAIVATPILLGYGLNIETDSYTDWVEDGDGLNLTNFLYNVVDASKRNYTGADIYQLNSDVFYYASAHITPTYQSISDTRTPIKIRQYYTSATTTFNSSWVITASFIVNGSYDATNYYDIVLTFDDNTTSTYSHIKSFNIAYDQTSLLASVDFSISEPGGYLDAGYDFLNVRTAKMESHGAPIAYLSYNNPNNSTYADISAGYKLNTDISKFSAPIANLQDYYNHGIGITTIEPSGICKDILLTFNLNSISDNSYYLGIMFPSHDKSVGPTLSLEKRTVGGAVQWYYKVYGDNTEHPLYYNPDLSSNTYQLYFNENTGGEFRYIGAWQDTVYPAPALLTYPFEYVYGGAGGVDYIFKFDILGQTPIMRMDYAQVAAYEYKIIRDTTYNPVDFKQNPETILSNVEQYGSSLVFGGNTYVVSNGKITVDSKNISVNNLELSSVFTGSGYDNMINGTVVSSTLTPSSIVFNGDWSMVVKTYALKSVYKEETKWIPGSFAWDGVDTDFKIVGLLTSVGVFIALGVYAHRSGAKVWPLLLVCLGAGAMFFFMI